MEMLFTVSYLLPTTFKMTDTAECRGGSVELSEAEAHWRKFWESLSERGLHGVEMITSDNHAGLKAARMCVFLSVPWQRCQFHLQQNASSHFSKKSMEKEAHENVRSIFNAEQTRSGIYAQKDR